ncbi:MAG TPA: penicillin-binding protein 2 [Actinomycetaceae bacterium]|nr:penicillin-binding protein 2 [Actinomycetaceae bacterium]
MLERTGMADSMEPRRRRAAAIALAIVLAVFASRLVLVQIVQGPALAAEARSERLRTYPIEAPRGQILGSGGEILATSGERVNVGVNQQLVSRFIHRVDDEVVGTGAAAAAELLAPILGRDKAELGGELIGESTWKYLVKGLQPSEWREIKELRIPGIEPEWIAVREYPNGNTAGNVVGFVGKDHYGLAGLEQSYDAVLTGVPGSETVEIGNGGQVIPTGVNEVVDAQPGATLHTTINRDLQYLAQEKLEEIVTRFSAEWAGVAVMEVGTGNLLVLADSGAVDPNDPSASSEGDRGARSVTDPYEPGSTGKVLTVAAAINEGVVTPESAISVPYSTVIDGQAFTDFNWHPDMEMTPAGILATSSNIGTVTIGNMLSDEQRYEYMRAFGFGQTTDLGLPGESAGILPTPDQWDGRTRLINNFGQGFAITLVQNVSMIATIANDGIYTAPRLVSSIEHADGAVTYPEWPEDRQVLRPEAAQTMIDLLEQTIKRGGTGVLARLDDYRVAGKTGTAQIPDANGKLTQLVANFIGIVPADNPRFAIAVVVYRPQAGLYGGIVAAPIFKSVATDALEYYGVPPSTGTAPELPWSPDGATSFTF